MGEPDAVLDSQPTVLSTRHAPDGSEEPCLNRLNSLKVKLAAQLDRQDERDHASDSAGASND